MPNPGRAAAGTAVARGASGDGRLEDVQVIYQQQPKVEGANHFGSRLVFARDGTCSSLRASASTTVTRRRTLAADLGKIVRINPDGSVPRDNPFVGRGRRAAGDLVLWPSERPGARRSIPQTGQLWTVEHGARGGDELNQPEAGKNYGWPVITYGVDYSGARSAKARRSTGMEQPFITGIR